MQTLKQFLQNLSYKKDKTVARSAKALVLAIKKSKVPEKLNYYINDSKKCTMCDNLSDSDNPFLCKYCHDAAHDNALGRL